MADKVDVLAVASIASDIQASREAQEKAIHVERIEWLSQPAPRWACGARVDAHSRNVLLKQSLANIGPQA